MKTLQKIAAEIFEFTGFDYVITDNNNGTFSTVDWNGLKITGSYDCIESILSCIANEVYKDMQNEINLHNDYL